MDASALESTFPSDATHTGGLQLGSDGIGHPRDGTRSLGQLWNFSLSDLTTDFSNLGGNVLTLLKQIVYQSVILNLAHN